MVLSMPLPNLPLFLIPTLLFPRQTARNDTVIYIYIYIYIVANVHTQIPTYIGSIKPCSQSDARSCGSLRNVVAEVCERDYAKPQTSASSSGGSAGDGPEVYLSVACVAVDQ